MQDEAAFVGGGDLSGGHLDAGVDAADDMACGEAGVADSGRQWGERGLYRCWEEFGGGIFGVFLGDLEGVEGAVVELDVGHLAAEDELEVLAGGEALVEGGVEGSGPLGDVDVGGGDAHLRGYGGDGRDAVVGGEGDPDVGHAAVYILVEPGEEVVHVDVDGVDHGALLGCVGADLVAEDVGGGDADGEDVGDVVAAHLFAGDEGLGEVEEVGDGCGRGAYIVVEVAGAGFGFGDGAGGAVAVVEGLGPGGKLLLPVGGGDELAAGVVEPEGSVGGVAGGEDGGAVLEGDAEELGLALGGEDDFVAEGGGEFVAGGCADVLGVGVADGGVAFVFDGG